MLEQQHNELITASQEVCRYILPTDTWDVPPIAAGMNGNPRTHGIPAALRVLRSHIDGGGRGEYFEEDYHKLQSRLVSESASSVDGQGPFSSSSHCKHAFTQSAHHVAINEFETIHMTDRLPSQSATVWSLVEDLNPQAGQTYQPFSQKATSQAMTPQHWNETPLYSSNPSDCHEVLADEHDPAKWMPIRFGMRSSECTGVQPPLWDNVPSQPDTVYNQSISSSLHQTRNPFDIDLFDTIDANNELGGSINFRLPLSVAGNPMPELPTPELSRAPNEDLNEVPISRSLSVGRGMYRLTDETGNPHLRDSQNGVFSLESSLPMLGKQAFDNMADEFQQSSTAVIVGCGSVRSNNPLLAVHSVEDTGYNSSASSNRPDHLFDGRSEKEIRLSCYEPTCKTKSSFCTSSELRRHDREQHQGSSFDCSLCGKKFRRKYRYRKHMQSSHQSRDLTVFR